jgi:hypothetical protein
MTTDPQLLQPGLYVVRLPHGAKSKKLIVESVCFRKKPGLPDDTAELMAEGWRDFVQSEHPKDDVFVIEKKV